MSQEGSGWIPQGARGQIWDWQKVWVRQRKTSCQDRNKWKWGYLALPLVGNPQVGVWTHQMTLQDEEQLKCVKWVRNTLLQSAATRRVKGRRPILRKIGADLRRKKVDAPFLEVKGTPSLKWIPFLPRLKGAYHPSNGVLVRNMYTCLRWPWVYCIKIVAFRQMRVW